MKIGRILKMLIIENEGPEIIKTNYFQSEMNQSGKIYVSVNAGCFRVLLPESLKNITREMKTGNEIIISRGPWLQMGLNDGFEFLFDDYTDNPFALHLDPGQFDRLPIPEDSNREVRFIVYIKGLKKVIDTKAYYRAVKSIPCLEPLKQ
jgi:hypothetical protein